MNTQTRRPSASRTAAEPAAVGRCRLGPAPARRRDAGADRSPHRHGQRPTGRGARRCTVRISSPALIGAEQTTTTNERGQLRFPSVPPGAYVLDIQLHGFRVYREERHPDWRGRHAREDTRPDIGGARRIGGGRSDGLPHRRPGPWVRDSIRRRGSRRDPDATIQFVRLGQDGARHLADVAGGRQRPRVRSRFGCGPESVSHRRHERHRDRQRRRASRSRRRFHSGTADPDGGRVGRVRQRPGRRRERDHQVRR